MDDAHAVTGTLRHLAAHVDDDDYVTFASTGIKCRIRIKAPLPPRDLTTPPGFEADGSPVPLFHSQTGAPVDFEALVRPWRAMHER